MKRSVYVLIAVIKVLDILMLCNYMVCIDAQTVTLLSFPTDVVENSSVVLSCSSDLQNVQRHVFSNAVRTVARILADCSLFGSIDTTLYSHSCADGTVELTIKTVTRYNQGDMWTCAVVNGSSYLSNVVTFDVKVPITSVKLLNSSQDSIIVTENVTTQFQCETSFGKPVATVLWFKDNGTPGSEVDDILITSSHSSTVYNTTTYISTNTLTFLPSRTDHGMRIYCKARNINSSSWLTSSVKLQLTINYASGLPSIQGFANNSIYYMIRNTTQTITCSVTGGRPLPQLSWSCYNGQVGGSVIYEETVSSSITWTSTGLESACYCTSQQVLTGSTNTVLFIKVLYPPDAPTITMSSRQVSVVYRTQGESLTVTCTSSASPAPNRYTWLLPNGQTTLGQQLHIDSVEYHVNQIYTCMVENRMIPSVGAEVVGSIKAHLPIILSYSPRHICKDQSEEEVEAVPGRHAVLSATFAAFPLPSVFIWSRCKSTDVCSVIHNSTNIIISTFGFTSSLTILNTRQEDFGKYELIVGNGIGQPYNYTFFLRREKVSANVQDTTETSTSLIGGVVGGVVALAVIVVAVVIGLCLIRRKTGNGGKETTSYTTPKQQDEYADVHPQTIAEQNDPNSKAGAGISATSTSHSEYIGLSHYGNVQNTYEELGDGIDLHTPTEKTYTNVIS